jgi:hypothetical protein
LGLKSKAEVEGSQNKGLKPMNRSWQNKRAAAAGEPSSRFGMLRF